MEGSYENDVCIDFKRVTIKDIEGVEHCFFKEGGILYYQKKSEDKQEVSAKNKRLEALFKQLGYPQIIENADNVIDCQNAEDFKQEIQKLIEQSQQKEAPPISKIFIIPGHAFVMVFKEGTAHCYDNGAIDGHPLCKEYKQVLKNKKVKYQKFSMSNKLSVLLADGSKVEISMPKKSLVCRHLACVVFKKIEALISLEDNIIQGLKRWSKRSRKAGEEEVPGTLIARASSPPIKRTRIS